MVQRRVNTTTGLEGIAGVGKYGPQFLALLQTAGETRETSGQPS
jgi:hypothetical protein